VEKNTREEFRAQFGQDDLSELRSIAEKELKLKIPKSIGKEKLLDLMYDAYSGSSVGSDEAISAETPVILPGGDKDPTVLISCKAPGGRRRAGRFWACGKHRLPSSKCEQELLDTLRADPAFSVKIEVD